MYRKYYKDVDGMMLDVGPFTKGLEVEYTVYLFTSYVDIIIIS